MAFPVGWNRKCAIVIDHTKVTADLTAFPVLITEANLPDEMKTSGGGDAAQSDGGDIRFSSDSAGASQLACEIVSWTQNATPSLATAEIHVPVNVLTTSDVTIYVWYNAGGGLSQPAANASFGSQAVWDTNYSAVYHLQTIGAATSGTSADSTVNANTVTNSGSNVTAVAAKIGNGGSFAGASYKLTRSGSLTNIPGGTGTRTLEIWFKRNANNAAQEFFGWGDNANGGRFTAYWQNDGRLYCECASRNTYFAWTADTNWHYIVFTLPSGTLTTNILGYLDGVSKTMTPDGNGISTNAAGTITISSIPTVASGYVDGFLDEGRISKIARSATWISTQYNNQNSPSTFSAAGTPGGNAPPADVTQLVTDSIALSDAVSGFVLGESAFSDTLALTDSITITTSGEAAVLAADDILSFADSAVANFGIHTPPSLRGNIDYDQIRVSARSGDGSKLLTLKGSFVPGNTVVFDADGNLIDAGHS